MTALRSTLFLVGAVVVTSFFGVDTSPTTLVPLVVAK